MQIKDDFIVEESTGEVLGSTLLKFQNWDKSMYEESGIRGVTPMTAQELDKDKLEKYLDEHIVVYEQKFDGHRATMHLLDGGNRVFSRNISKKTNWFTENSDQVPQLRDILVPEEYLGTILDGEVLIPQDNCSCRGVQGVMGALPKTAIDNQINGGFAYLEAFDILNHKGTNIHRMRYWRRKLYLLDVVLALNSAYIKFAPMYMDKPTWELYKSLIPRHLKYLMPYLEEYVQIVDLSPKELCDKFISEGKEGIMLKDLYGRYEEKRSKNYIKMKGHKTYDCVIVGYEEPTAEVNLEERKTKEEDWLYWETYEKDIITTGLPKHWNRDECCPVSKFYAMNWIGAIHIGVWKERQLQYFLNMFEGNLGEAKKFIKNKIQEGTIREEDKHYRELVKVGRCSGLDDKTRAEISENKDKYLGRVVEVEAQHIINSDTGSLQHPRFIQFRIDKNLEDCTFEDHIRKYGEEEVHR